MPRTDPPPIDLASDELTCLVQFLDFYRAALVDRCYDLTDEQLRQTPLPTSLSLARIIGHMALVERFWFDDRFAGEGGPDYAEALDWEADEDAEMTLAESWGQDELFSVFDDAVASSRSRVAAAESLDQLSAEPNADGEHWNLRWIMVHMIEEYARHCGHADLIREAVDGDTLS